VIVRGADDPSALLLFDHEDVVLDFLNQDCFALFSSFFVPLLLSCVILSVDVSKELPPLFKAPIVVLAQVLVSDDLFEHRFGEDLGDQVDPFFVLIKEVAKDDGRDVSLFRADIFRDVDCSLDVEDVLDGVI
jgi:hypothetical protein